MRKRNTLRLLEGFEKKDDAANRTKDTFEKIRLVLQPLPVGQSNQQLKIEQGEYSLGQIVVPQNFTKTAIKNGNMITQEVSISGRKFPLEDIRKNLLIHHTKYMRLTTDEEFSNMELSEVQQKLRNLGKFSDNSDTLEELLIKLKKWNVPVILHFGMMVRRLETTVTF